MRRANEETHAALVKQKKETKRVQNKVETVVIPLFKFVPYTLLLFFFWQLSLTLEKGDESKDIAVARTKVKCARELQIALEKDQIARDL
jgi:hypothetical protein